MSHLPSSPSISPDAIRSYRHARHRLARRGRSARHRPGRHALAAALDGSSPPAGRAAGARRRVSLVEAADGVVQVADGENGVVRRPPVVESVRPDARQSAARELGYLLIRERVPLVDDDGVVLVVVGSGAGACVQEWNRLVKIVKNRRLPVQVRRHDVLRQLLRYDDRVAVVVVRGVLAPVQQRNALRSEAEPLRLSIHIDLAIATIDFPEPVGVARIRWLPENSSIAASSWCG